MLRVLITGMSGTGKSSVVEALAARGYRAVDADLDGFSHAVSVSSDELTGPGRGEDWVWREDRMLELLSDEDGEALFVSGCAANQGRFYPRFDHIVLLSAPAELIAHRLATRTNNPYGKGEGDIERTLELQRTIEPLLRRGAGLEVDTTAPLDRVVSTILAHVMPARPA